MLTLGNVQENLTLRSLTRIGVHEALVFVLRLVGSNAFGTRDKRDQLNSDIARLRELEQ